MKDLSQLSPTPQFSKELTADEIKENYPRQVSGAFFSYVDTKTPTKPSIVHVSSSFVNDLGVKMDSDKILEILSGTKRFQKFKPYAMCYGGHQFGHWAGQLGDGRAINIAEINIDKINWKFQLKGAGPTPYSRTADGFAVLRSSIREYLCSEAMHHLGIPTTRALSLVTTGDLVMRDILYNGNPKNEIGAIVCRVSPSFIRFGNFEILSARKDISNLKKLVDYTIKYHFTHLKEGDYIDFFREVVEETKEMIVHWQRVGFVHGVMNTDNMSILGLTIDYGPYGWLEDYNVDWTPNTTDAQYKRYKFGSQPEIALWNLTQLANAIYPLINDVKPLQEVLDTYVQSYRYDYHKMMCSKLGLYQIDEVLDEFIKELTDNLQQSEIDMTIFFREISNKIIIEFFVFWEILKKSSYLDEKGITTHRSNWEKWHSSFILKIKLENINSTTRKTQMKAINPKYVLRNYMAQLAIQDAEKGDYQLIDELYQLLLKPYNEQIEKEKWFAKRPDWARNKIGCSILSCSS